MRPRENLHKNDTVNPSDKHPRGYMSDRWLLVDRQHGQWKWKRVDVGIHIVWIISSSWADLQDRKKKKQKQKTETPADQTRIFLV